MAIFKQKHHIVLSLCVSHRETDKNNGFSTPSSANIVTKCTELQLNENGFKSSPMRSGNIIIIATTWYNKITFTSTILIPI